MRYHYSQAVGAKIVLAAAKFVGLTEVRSNASWDLAETDGHDAIADAFKSELLKVGWQSGWPYCAAACEVFWRTAYQGRPELTLVRDILTPGCLRSFKNAAEVGWTSKVPSVGAIGIMRKGDTEFGHAFIVTAVRQDSLLTIEANTSPNVADTNRDREGDGVYCKTRALTYKPTTGLHLIGFITPLIYD